MFGAIKESVTYARNLQMMLNGHVRMEQEQIWIICVRQLNLQLEVEQKQ